MASCSVLTTTRNTTRQPATIPTLSSLPIRTISELNTRTCLSTSATIRLSITMTPSLRFRLPRSQRVIPVTFRDQPIRHTRTRQLEYGVRQRAMVVCMLSTVSCSATMTSAVSSSTDSGTTPIVLMPLTLRLTRLLSATTIRYTTTNGRSSGLLKVLPWAMPLPVLLASTSRTCAMLTYC